MHGVTPHELLEKLAALVPPPRVNLIRYHGILAPSARDRDKIVPQQEPPEPCGEDRDPCPHHMPQRLAWAVLLARVFSIDVSTCDRCGGRMRVIAALTEPASIRRYLQGVGPARSTATHRATEITAANQARVQRG